MKKTIFAVFFSLIICCLCASCTSDNSKETILCEKIAVDMQSDGTFDITAIYKTDSKEETFVEKSFVCADQNTLLENLLSVRENAMYTPLKFLFIGKSVDNDSALRLISAMMNNTKFNLKCRVFECENAKAEIYSQPDEQNCFSFAEYYRTKANLR